MQNDKPKIGRITNNRISNNRDSDRPVRIMDVELTDPEDIQTVEQMTLSGIDSSPPDDSLCQVVPNGNAWKVSSAINDKIDKSASLAKGEIEIYSSDPGGNRFAKKATSRWKNNKDIEHNANTIVTNADNIYDLNTGGRIDIDAEESIDIDSEEEILINAVKKLQIISDKEDIELKSLLKAISIIATTTVTMSAGTAISIAATAALLLSGSSIVLNSGTKSAVNYPDLNTAMASLASWLDSHTHSAGGSGPPSSPSGLDISASESSGVKVP